MVLCLFVDCGFKSGKKKSRKQQQWETEKGLNASFFRVPAIVKHQGKKIEDLTTERRRKWISVISRDDLSEEKLCSDRVCSRHFVSGKSAADWDKHNVDWVPSLSLGHTKIKVQDHESIEDRATRAVERRKRFNEAIEAEIQAKMHKLNEPGLPVKNLFDEEHFGEDFEDREPAASNEETEKGQEKETCDAETATKDLNESKTFDESYFMNDDAKVRFYTGLPTYDVLLTVFDFVNHHATRKSSVLSSFQEFILTLMKLRLNVPYQDLSYRFEISVSTVARVFQSWITLLDSRLSSLIVWPEREALLATMPKCFQYSFGNKTTVIIDCFEVFIDRPSNLLARAQTFSNYKHHNTVKILIGITPQGTISFVSEAWGGRTSDKFLTENCGILKLLRPGDVVMADRGFTIEESVWYYQAKLTIPAFTKGKSQLDPIDVEKTRGIANVRIHVERVIGTLRQKYTILQATLPTTFLTCGSGQDEPIIDKILRVCSALINLCPPIIPFD